MSYSEVLRENVQLKRKVSELEAKLVELQGELEQKRLQVYNKILEKL